MRECCCPAGALQENTKRKVRSACPSGGPAGHSYQIESRKRGLPPGALRGTISRWKSEARSPYPQDIPERLSLRGPCGAKLHAEGRKRGLPPGALRGAERTAQKGGVRSCSAENIYDGNHRQGNGHYAPLGRTSCWRARRGREGGDSPCRRGASRRRRARSPTTERLRNASSATEC